MVGADRRNADEGFYVPRRQGNVKRVAIGGVIGGSRDFAVSFPADTGLLASARHEFDEWLHGLGATDERRTELAVVFSELGSNAVREGCGGNVEVEAHRTDGSIELEVRNAIADEVGDLRDDDDVGGRGLLIVAAFTEAVEVDRDGEHLVVRCRGQLS